MIINALWIFNCLRCFVGDLILSCKNNLMREVIKGKRSVSAVLTAIWMSDPRSRVEVHRPCLPASPEGVAGYASGTFPGLFR